MKSRVSILVFVLFNSARVCVAQEMAQSVFNCDNSMLPLAAEILDHFSIRSVLLEIKASVVSRPTRPTEGFESVGLWSIGFESVGLLDWARSSRPNRPSFRNS